MAKGVPCAVLQQAEGGMDAHGVPEQHDLMGSLRFGRIALPSRDSIKTHCLSIHALLLKITWPSQRVLACRPAGSRSAKNNNNAQLQSGQLETPRSYWLETLGGRVAGGPSLQSYRGEFKLGTKETIQAAKSPYDDRLVAFSKSVLSSRNVLPTFLYDRQNDAVLV
jgi:hypothetical protein